MKGGKIRGENGKRGLEVYFESFGFILIFMKVFGFYGSFGSTNFTTTQISI